MAPNRSIRCSLVELGDVSLEALVQGVLGRDVDAVRPCAVQCGPFGKLHIRYGKGSRGSGPRERTVPLLNQAGRTLCWFVEDVWGQFGDDHARLGAPLFPSERVGGRVGYDALRAGLAPAVAIHVPQWTDRLTPHVLRHFCASQLYLNGVDLISIQEALGHVWVATTMRYVHVHRSHIEQAWIDGQQRAARRVEGAG
jgi:integrase/recombinase XerD